jgi:hypothetical protein
LTGSETATNCSGGIDRINNTLWDRTLRIVPILPERPIVCGPHRVRAKSRSRMHAIYAVDATEALDWESERVFAQSRPRTAAIGIGG